MIGTEHLALEPDNSDLQIFISEKTDVVSAVKEAVLASYDVAEDDQRLRGQMLHCAECDRGAEFDRLRKNYPVRREFSKYRIVNAERQREGQLIGGYPIHIGGCEPGVGYDLQNEPPVEIINPPMEKFIPQKKPPPQSGRGR